jgi:hypothetical protein
LCSVSFIICNCFQRSSSLVSWKEWLKNFGMALVWCSSSRLSVFFHQSLCLVLMLCRMSGCDFDFHLESFALMFIDVCLQGITHYQLQHSWFACQGSFALLLPACSDAHDGHSEFIFLVGSASLCLFLESCRAELDQMSLPVFWVWLALLRLCKEILACGRSALNGCSQWQRNMTCGLTMLCSSTWKTAASSFSHVLNMSFLQVSICSSELKWNDEVVSQF